VKRLYFFLQINLMRKEYIQKAFSLMEKSTMRMREARGRLDREAVIDLRVTQRDSEAVV
jgi:hypothetical protein